MPMTVCGPPPRRTSAPRSAGVAAEVAGPDPVAEHHRRRADLVVAREAAPQPGLDPENAEVARGHLEIPHEGRAVVAVQVHAGAHADAGQNGEGAAPVAQQRDGGLRLDGNRPRRPVAHDIHDPIRLRERQRPEEHGVDHAADRGHGAEAETEDEDRGQRERGAPRERTDAQSNVLPEVRGELPPAPLPLPPPVDVDARGA